MNWIEKPKENCCGSCGTPERRWVRPVRGVSICPCLSGQKIEGDLLPDWLKAITPALGLIDSTRTGE